MRFFKVVDEDMTDLMTHTVRFRPGQVFTAPGDGPFPGQGWLHAAPTPWTTLQGQVWWPARLFEAHGVPRASHPVNFEYGFTALVLGRELPRWLLLGVHGDRVLDLIDRARTLSYDQACWLADTLSGQDERDEMTAQREYVERNGDQVLISLNLGDDDGGMSASVLIARTQITRAVFHAAWRATADDPRQRGPWTRAGVHARVAVTRVALGQDLTWAQRQAFAPEPRLGPVLFGTRHLLGLARR